MRIDPKLAIEFVTIAEEGSFTRAADRLRVAQPWLSARLRKLEDMLGFRLLDRTTRQIALTDQGLSFLTAARALAEASLAVDRAALQLSRSDRHVLRIGAAPYTKTIVQRRDLIDSFRRSRGNVSVELETGWSIALIDGLHAGKIDLTFLMGHVDPAQFDCIALTAFGLSLAMSRKHPLAGAGSLKAVDVARWPVHVFTRSLYPQLWDHLYAPLIEAGARLTEVPDMAEGMPNRIEAVDTIAAFFDFGDDDASTSDVVRIPLAASVEVPFNLVRLKGSVSREAQEFWHLALQRTQNISHD